MTTEEYEVILFKHINFCKIKNITSILYCSDVFYYLKFLYFSFLPNTQ